MDPYCPSTRLLADSVCVGQSEIKVIKGKSREWGEGSVTTYVSH